MLGYFITAVLVAAIYHSYLDYRVSEINDKLADSVLETIRWKTDVENLADECALLSDELAEADNRFNKASVSLLTSQENYRTALNEVNYVKMELDILENELDDMFDSETRRKLHNTVQDQFTRKWNAYSGATLTPKLLLSNSNND